MSERGKSPAWSYCGRRSAGKEIGIATYRGCRITFLNRGGNSSHVTWEAVKKVSGGGKGCSQGKIARNSMLQTNSIGSGKTKKGQIQ